jgi:rhodanese-related sulfurtransferase
MIITLDKITDVENAILVDIREEYERESYSLATALNAPMATLVDEIGNFSASNNYILFCQSGSRSTNLVKLLKAIGHTNFYSLEGGATLLSEKNYK